MTFHARSMTELGRLFVDLTDRLAMGGAAAALEMIRTSFEAEAVLLSAECRNRSRPPMRDLGTVAGSAISMETLVGAAGNVTEPRGHHAIRASYLDADSATRYVLRLFRRTDFDTDEHALTELLLAQLARGIESSNRRAHADVERALFSDMLDRLQAGVVVLDNLGRIRSVSTQAGRILEKRDGLQLVGGRICALNPAEDKRFQAAIRAALNAPDGDGIGHGLSLTRRGIARKIGVILRKIPGGGAEGQPALSIVIRDADIAPDVEAGIMRQIFDLTPAEAAVARRLTDGLSLEEAAAALDISRNTARAHLRSIFSKSGIKRQTELVRLVLNSAVVL